MRFTNDTDSTKDMQEIINQQMRQFSKKVMDDLSEYKKEIGKLCLAQANSNSKLANDLAAIQNSIHAHAIGVQNVYNEMQEMKKQFDAKEGSNHG